MMDWELQPGDLIKRTDLHARYGGSRQGGIGPSAQTPNVLVFSDPRTGAQYGYLDHWEGPVFHYTGEGQVGAQGCGFFCGNGEYGNRARKNKHPISAGA